MNITKFEKTVIPNTLEGQKFANEYREKLRFQGALRSWSEDTISIIITAEYHYNVKEDNGNDD